MSLPATLTLDRVTSVIRPSRGVPGFALYADLTLSGPLVVAVLGANGAGKTTFFNLISGRKAPTTGRVVCDGHDMQQLVFAHRSYLVNHQTQRHDVRVFGYTGWSRIAIAVYERLRRRVRLPSSSAKIHLWDEPDLSDPFFLLQLHHLSSMKAAGNLVLLSAHPHSARELAMLRMACDKYLFLQHGSVEVFSDQDALLAHPAARAYLGKLGSLPEGGRVLAETGAIATTGSSPPQTFNGNPT